jgi:hypothetical protein
VNNEQLEKFMNNEMIAAEITSQFILKKNMEIVTMGMAQLKHIKRKAK